jgi:hypothetical protein
MKRLVIALHFKAGTLPFELNKTKPLLPRVLSLMSCLALDRLAIENVLGEIRGRKQFRF